MEFGEDWDALMIEQAQRLQPGRPGAVVSSYPDPFTFEGMQAVHATRPGILAHVVKPGTEFAADHLVLAFEAHPVDGPEPVPGFHVGAGCLFAPGSFAQYFPYDPAFYFHGEEQSIALRLFTHGWDIFHMAAMPVWHLYNIPQEGKLRRALHWDEAHDSQRGDKWWTLEQVSRARLGDLAAGRIPGVYGLGNVRSVADYADFSGIDYAARTIAPRSYSPTSPG
jgi:hypothetical protein